MSSDRILLTVMRVNSTIRINSQGQNVYMCVKIAFKTVAIDWIYARCKCAFKMLPLTFNNMMFMIDSGLICCVDPKKSHCLKIYHDVNFVIMVRIQAINPKSGFYSHKIQGVQNEQNNSYLWLSYTSSIQWAQFNITLFFVSFVGDPARPCLLFNRKYFSLKSKQPSKMTETTVCLKNWICFHWIW